MFLHLTVHEYFYNLYLPVIRGFDKRNGSAASIRLIFSHPKKHI